MKPGRRLLVSKYNIAAAVFILAAIAMIGQASPGVWPAVPGAAAAGVIRVAVEQGPASSGSATELAAQLNDDTFFDFTASVVTADQIDSLGELANYDVVIIGDSGGSDNDWTLAMASALQDWVQNHGGGVVSVGWADFATGQGVDDARDAVLDNVMPIDAFPDTTNIFCGGPPATIQIIDNSHPVTSGLSDFVLSTSGDVEISPGPPDATAGQVLGTASSGSCTDPTRNAIVIGMLGNGRLVYLGPVYLGSVSGYTNGDLRSGSADRLLEQAVQWAALGAVPTPTPTPTVTGTPPSTPTATPRPRTNVGGAVGAVIAAAGQERKTRVTAGSPPSGATAAPALASAPNTNPAPVIAPPKTGDGGLAAGQGAGFPWAFALALAFAAAAVGVARNTSRRL